MKSYLEAVILDNFRNIKFAMLTFDRGLSIIYGNNAQGKTNEPAQMIAAYFKPTI